MDSHKREEAMANDRGWKSGPGTEQEQECSTRALAKKMKKKRDNFSATITSNHALSFFIQDVVHELVQDVVHELIIQDNNNNEQVVYLDGKL